ncbi:hypothetical protein NQZ79_g6917 [Umbelopsis isabellina]|nr:hypothetical protein NQZ79_g6917 [Umbelopsis isabellina]
MSPVEGQSSAGPLTAINGYQIPGIKSRMSPPYDYNPNFKPAKGILKQRSRLSQKQQLASTSWITTLNSKLSGNPNTHGNQKPNNDKQPHNIAEKQQDVQSSPENQSPTGLAGGLSTFRKFISNATNNRANSYDSQTMMSLDNSSLTSLNSVTSDMEDSAFELDPEDLKRVRFSIQYLTTEYFPYDNPQYTDDFPNAEDANELKVGSAEVNPATLEVAGEEDSKFELEKSENLDVGSNTCTQTTFEEVLSTDENEQPKRAEALTTTSASPCTPKDLLTFYETACRNKDEHMFHPLVRQLQENAHLSSITSIDLSNYLIDREVAEPISDILTLEHNIQRLIVQNCGLEDETIKLILNGLLRSNSVKYLSIANNKKIKSNGFKYVAICMRESTSLNGLNLSQNSFDRKSMQMICHGLASKRTSPNVQALQTLIMDACLFRPSLFEALAVGVKNSNSLKTLSLRHNRINQQGASWIGVMLRDYADRVHISSSGDSISSDSSIQYGLERLALDGNDLRLGLQFIAQALKRNQSIKELGLSGCKIDARNLTFLGDALVSDQQLRVLKLELIIDDATQKYNQTLEKLNISNNDLGTPVKDGFQALASGLQHHPCLKDLDLKATSMKTEDVIELAKTLPNFKSLMRMDIRDNPKINMLGYSCLADAMKKNYSLAFLEIDCSQANQELTQLQSEILTHCSRNTRNNFAQTNGNTVEENNTLVNGRQNGAITKTKTQATARMSLQDRLAAVTRGASGHSVRQSPSEEVASEHHSLLEEMLTAYADQTVEEPQDVRETLDRLHLQCETSQRLIMSYAPRIADEALLGMFSVLFVVSNALPYIETCILAKLLETNDKLTAVSTRYVKVFDSTVDNEKSLEDNTISSTAEPQVAKEASFAIGDDDEDDDDIPVRPNTSASDSTSTTNDDSKNKLKEKRRETEKEEAEALKLAKQLADSDPQEEN